MKAVTHGKDSELSRKFFLTELIANLTGAPLAILYAMFMVDFEGLDAGYILLRIFIVLIGNQILLALPMNLIFGRAIRAGLKLWRAGERSQEDLSAFYRFLMKVPALQALLILIRMFIGSASAIFLFWNNIPYALEAIASFIFALYASFVNGIIIYYYLYKPVSAVAEDLVREMNEESRHGAQAGANRLTGILSILPALVPTMITTVGILILIALMAQEPASVDFLAGRVSAALVMNILTIIPILILNQRFHRRRLRVINYALEQMVERGETSRQVPTDLADIYASTADQINQALNLFRLLLSRMDEASGRLGGMVANFSSQIRQTVASSTQQAAAVKEMVGTMESADQTSKRIQEQARGLSGNAQESQVLVDDGFGKVQDAILKMDEIKEANIQTHNEIGELTMQISSIGEIIDIINNIANQTRIIAFNAELEASSAGVAGTSFRIVAEEIRRLANSTVESLVGIKGRITEIQQSSDRLLATSEEETLKIDQGMKLSGDLNDIFVSIRMSSESTSLSAEGIGSIILEQNQAYDQIFTTLKQISEGAEQVLATANISGSEVSRLQNVIDELKETLKRFEYRRQERARVLVAGAD